jgi:uncharacterized membrane protein
MQLPLKGSRLVLSGLASSGALESAYLTISHVTSTPVTQLFCGATSSTSCSDILSGPYSVIPFTDIPLASVAFVAYSTVALLSLQQLQQNSPQGSLMLFLTTAMATFSIYLMTLLGMVIHGSCTYCMLSAAISTAMALTAWSIRLQLVGNTTKAIIISTTSITLTSVLSGVLFYLTTALGGLQPVGASTAVAGQILAHIEAQEKNVPPVITKHSSTKALELSCRLKAQNAMMYGAYWCSHCFNQKQELGIEACHVIPYIECDKEGKDSQFAACKQKKVPGYPTWEIAGQLFPGEKTLDELTNLLNKLEAKT